MSKVLLINGSPHVHGCTFTALDVVAKELDQNGVETEIVHVGHKDIRGCIGCYKCRELGKCVFMTLSPGHTNNGCIIIFYVFICITHINTVTLQPTNNPNLVVS